MNKQQVMERIGRSRIVAIIRSDSADYLVEVVRALLAGGINIAEITMTVPGAVEVIRAASQEFTESELLLGAGTVISRQMAEDAVAAGARFCVAPNFDPEMVSYCIEKSIAVCPGAFTPSEIQTAWASGADFVKVFPARIGGPRYIKDLLGPLPHVKIMVTGGVNHETASQYLKAGAMAVGVGGPLFDKEMIDNADWPQITENAKRLVASV
jgi:2-dehydro-3-deoxyphosphogluconate aldolase/(4S)-4-hydroxy-2-oxoglutarate aldolase